jgi:hypothetical protein
MLSTNLAVESLELVQQIQCLSIVLGIEKILQNSPRVHLDQQYMI